MDNIGRLLLVDDNPLNLSMMQKRLEMAGYEIHCVNTGVDALKSMATQEYAAVLLDQSMPQMNGMEVLRTIRKHLTKSELPVVMVTANSESNNIVDCLNSGANDFIAKPVEFKIVATEPKDYGIVAPNTMLFT